MTTAMDVVIQCENRLGFVHTPGKPLYKARAIEASKILRKLKAEHTVTLEDLLLAIEFCFRKREGVKSPVALFWRVEDARELANPEATTSDLSADVEAAISWELGQLETEDRDLWVGRLLRSSGPFRQEVLTDWRAAGRG